MADFSSYTHRWRATNTNTNHHDGNKVSKRNRQPVSCQPCRARKLKCDRGHPCETCSKRGDEPACHYGKAGVPSARKHEPRGTLKAQDRLRHLEHLVKQMCTPPSTSQLPSLAPPTPPTTTTATDEHVEVPLNRDKHATQYTGSTHWSAILDQIQELRTCLSTATSSPPEPPIEETHDDDDAAAAALSRSTNIFGAVQPWPMSDILRVYLPPKQQVDRYLSTYFNAKYLVLPWIHMYQFQRQYETFWADPTAVPPMWMAILFSILCIAEMIRHATDSRSSAPASDMVSRRQSFLAAAAQCLVIGDYTKAQPNVIQALSMFCQCKYTVTLDPSRETGMVLGVMVRLAYTMGYHRDPSKFPGQFTPFEAEMRRRQWSAMKQFDLMIAYQLGIPMNIMVDSWDTLPPQNLLDTDFDEDTKVLPPPRPDTEPSPMLYFITKSRLMDAYGRVCQHILSFPSRPCAIDDIMALDAEVRKADESIPALLRVRPVSQSYSDPPYLIMVRSNIMHVVNKSLCLLHRKYMNQGSTHYHDYSRTACIDAATRIVVNFIDVQTEFQPGGQLYHDRWMLSSFIVNDFLLAVTLLCFTWWQSGKLHRTKTVDTDRTSNWPANHPEAQSQYDLLVKAQGICQSYGQRSREAKHVAEHYT